MLGDLDRLFPCYSSIFCFGEREEQMQTRPSQQTQTPAKPKGNSLADLDHSRLGFQSIQIKQSNYCSKWLTIKYNTEIM